MALLLDIAQTIVVIALLFVGLPSGSGGDSFTENIRNLLTPIRNTIAQLAMIFILVVRLYIRVYIYIYCEIICLTLSWFFFSPSSCAMSLLNRYCFFVDWWYCWFLASYCCCCEAWSWCWLERRSSICCDVRHRWLHPLHSHRWSVPFPLC